MLTGIRIFRNEILVKHELFNTKIFFSGQQLWNMFKNKGIISQEIEMNLNILGD
jgi:hypothetical protein